MDRERHRQQLAHLTVRRVGRILAGWSRLGRMASSFSPCRSRSRSSSSCLLAIGGSGKRSTPSVLRCSPPCSGLGCCRARANRARSMLATADLIDASSPPGEASGHRLHVRRARGVAGPEVPASASGAPSQGPSTRRSGMAATSAGSTTKNTVQRRSPRWTSMS